MINGLRRRQFHTEVLIIGPLIISLILIALTSCGTAESVTIEATSSPPSTPLVTVGMIAPTLTPLAAEFTPKMMPTQTSETVLNFEGRSAFEYLEAQMAFGARWPGSEGHRQVGDYILEELTRLKWRVVEQPFEYQGVAVRNLIGVANEGVGDIIILGAHYDTRKTADQTPGGREQGRSVPGAVDGASGVAVLLELARTLELEKVPREVWLVFFDAEDNGDGGIQNWDWIVGSRYMADNLTVNPEAMVLVDLIGDADQQLFYEGNSDPALRERLWQIAHDLGFEESFIPQLKYTMIDDHVPFANRGIPAVDIIDFDYPYWHTVADTADKASPESLASVGKTLEYWLEENLE